MDEPLKTIEAAIGEPLKTNHYSCNKNRECTAKEKAKKVKKGDIVLLVAAGTDVTINFVTGISPFVSGVNPINIAANTARFEVVIDDRSNEGNHIYELSCHSCGSNKDPDNPVLIVEP